MKEWMKDNEGVVKFIAVVLSPILLPLVAAYWILGSLLEVVDEFIETLERWWDEP